jgi:propionyl-CoA carboxylase alpha chain
MRVAWNDSDCTEGFKLCKQEAMSSFGNDEMLVEKVGLFYYVLVVY